MAEKPPIRCCRHKIVLLLLISLFSLLFAYLSRFEKDYPGFGTFPNTETASFVLFQGSKVDYPQYISSKNETVILAWTTFFERKMEKLLGFANCANCRLTSNRSELNSAVAVLFHIRDTSVWDLPTVRFPWQRFVFMLFEAPPNTAFRLGAFPQNYFNWTMTYRKDSDVYSPYGSLEKRSTNQPIHRDIIDVAANKSKLVVWLASNCETQSRREYLVHEMRRYIDVDIWGYCGNIEICPKSKSVICEQRIEKEYKFFLAFENAICKDYITEKFWQRLKYNSVPVVLRREILRPFVPDSGFIAADDFSNAKELTDYLLYLDRNLTAYLTYFTWKSQYTHGGNLDLYFCKLCQKLHNQSEPIKYYSNINKWWNTESKCENNPEWS